MQQTKIIKYLNLINSHELAELTQLTKARYQVKFEGEIWELLPNSARYRCISDPSKTDYFYGDIKHFYNRYISRSLRLPLNHGKKWIENEKADLLEMVSCGLSVNQIANELDRHPVSIIEMIGLLYDDKSVRGQFQSPLYLDVAVRELL